MINNLPGEVGQKIISYLPPVALYRYLTLAKVTLCKEMWDRWIRIHRKRIRCIIHRTIKEQADLVLNFYMCDEQLAMCIYNELDIHARVRLIKQLLTDGEGTRNSLGLHLASLERQLDAEGRTNHNIGAYDPSSHINGFMKFLGYDP